jgi:hypothetical protein
MYKTTDLHIMHFMMLAERLKELIESPRLRADGARPVKTGGDA